MAQRQGEAHGESKLILKYRGEIIIVGVPSTLNSISRAPSLVGMVASYDLLTDYWGGFESYLVHG